MKIDPLVAWMVALSADGWVVSLAAMMVGPLVAWMVDRSVMMTVE
jgi:hypothetical protein